MTKKCIMLALALVLLLCCGCKTQEEISQSRTDEAAYGVRDVIYNEAQEVQKNLVRVAGQGSLSRTAEIAVLGFTLSAVAGDAESAAGEIQARVEALQALLAGDGVLEEDVQVYGLSVWPRYHYAEAAATYTVTDYEAHVKLSATIRDLGSLGGLLLHLAEGGLDYESLSYALADPQAAYNQALSLAVEEAAGKARAIAEAAGARLVPVPVSVEEGQLEPLLQEEAAGEEQLGSGALKEITVSASVQAEFEIID